MDKNLYEFLRDTAEGIEIKYTGKKLTAARGRLIRKIESAINKVKSLEKMSQSDHELSLKLEDLLREQLKKHKEQIDQRYSDEFLHKKATISTIITSLPKGVALQVRCISTCIDELKEAKTNKERFLGSVELLKSLGMTAATPIIYTVKFMVDHWYIVPLVFGYITGKISELNKKRKDGKGSKGGSKVNANNETIDLVESQDYLILDDPQSDIDAMFDSCSDRDRALESNSKAM